MFTSSAVKNVAVETDRDGKSGNLGNKVFATHGNKRCHYSARGTISCFENSSHL